MRLKSSVGKVWQIWSVMHDSLNYYVKLLLPIWNIFLDETDNFANKKPQGT